MIDINTNSVSSWNYFRSNRMDNNKSISEFKTDDENSVSSRKDITHANKDKDAKKDILKFHVNGIEIKLDDSKKLRNVFHNPEEYYRNYKLIKSSPYITSPNMDNTKQTENSINLTPGTNVNLGTHGGKDVVLHIREKDCGLSWGSVPIGSDHSNRYNDTLQYMLNYTKDKNGVYDPSKLSKEQQQILDKIQNTEESIMKRLGGPSDYQSLTKTSDAMDDLIRVANGQMSFENFGFMSDTSKTVKLALEKMGIDTLKEFHVNGQKFVFSGSGKLQYGD